MFNNYYSEINIKYKEIKTKIIENLNNVFHVCIIYFIAIFYVLYLFKIFYFLIVNNIIYLYL